MNCPQCDREHDAAARFCRGCGAILATMAPASAVVIDPPCPACAAPLKPGAKFCKQCGASTVTPEVPASHEAEVTADTAVPLSEKPAPRPTTARAVTDASTNTARGRGVVIVAAALVLVVMIGAGVTWRLLRQDDPVDPAQVTATDPSKPFDTGTVPSIVDKPPPEAPKTTASAQPAAPVPAPVATPAPASASVLPDSSVAKETPANLAEPSKKTPVVAVVKPKPPRAAPSAVAPSAVPAPMKDVALNLVRKGEAAFSQQDYSTAIANARAALDIEPGLARARQLLNEAQGAQQHAMNSISIQ